LKRGLQTVSVILLLIVPWGIFIPVLSKESFSRNFKMNSELTISDFSNFELLNDNQYISSLKSNDHIDFNYSGGASSRVEEYYILNFDEYGNCTDFSLEINVSYSYTGAMLSGGLFLIGSYYLENGNYFGKPEGDLFTYLSWTSVRDVWTSSGGVFEVCGYPDNIGDKYQTGSGSLGSSGVATFLLSRENMTLTLSVKQDEITKITHSWLSNVSRVINYLQVGLTIKSPADTGQTNLSMTSIVGIFDIIDKVTDISFIFPGFSTTATSIGLLFVGFFVLFNRKKQKFHAKKNSLVYN